MVLENSDDDVQSLGNIARPEVDNGPDWTVPSDIDDDVEPLLEEDSANAKGTEMSG